MPGLHVHFVHSADREVGPIAANSTRGARLAITTWAVGIALAVSVGADRAKRRVVLGSTR